MRISIDKKKRFQIIAIIISIGFVLAGIFGKRYFEVKVDYEQRLAAIKPDINKHNKILYIPLSIDAIVVP
ncbi:hypothetical protein [Butyrivibrio sp. LB2008]|uniref:hypothetical protein n=1 Tax=Butyrivibrio sp. LB2008 TaxID=1408305 RepID=UPI00047B1E84|nr:hypothetical protein [Butyrivibrio sp. LB2008]